MVSGMSAALSSTSTSRPVSGGDEAPLEEAMSTIQWHALGPLLIVWW